MCNTKKVKDNITNEDYLLELIETRSPDFHVSLFQLLITDKSQENLIMLILKNIAEEHLPLIHIINNLTRIKYLDRSYNNIFETNIKDQTYEASCMPDANTHTKQGILIQDDLDNDISSDARKFFDSVKTCLDIPTSKHLAHYVIPYCATQWKVLGDILGIPSHKIDSIEKNYHYVVEDCCRELLHFWLQSNTEASWQVLLSALNSPAIRFNFTQKHSVSSSLSKYQSHLKSVYTKRKTLTNDDWPRILHSHFVDLPLARVPKEISRPKLDSSLLFLHEKKDYERKMLDSYVQIFKYQDNGHQVTVIEGNPGSGKTTLSYKICKDWAEGIMLKHISLIILLILRDPRISDAMTLEDVITVGLGSRVQAEQICNDLTTSHGKDVIVWLEGWDELEYSKRSNSVFADLISCELLPEATVVVTTRPGAYNSIQQSAITQKVEILQFTEELFNKYIDFSFDEAADKIKFKQEINRVPSVNSLTYNPMCLAILLHVFVMSSNHTLPETLTEVYEKFLLIGIRRHNMKVNNDKSVFKNINKLSPKLKEILYRLGKLAYENLHNDQLIFSCDKVSEIVFGGEDVPIDFDGMCLLEVHDTELDIGIIKNYNFLHKSIQELLAAIYLMHLENIQQEKELKEIFGNMKFEMVWLFYTGLTKFKQLCVKNTFPNLSYALYTPTVKSKSLEMFTCYKKFDSVFYGCCHYCNNLHLQEIISREFFITLVLCCYEAKCPMLCNKICSHFYPNNTCFVYIPHSAATQQTMIALSYFVAHSNKNCALQFLAPVPDGLGLLYSYLKNPKEVCGRLWRLFYSMSIRNIDGLLTLVQSQCYLQSLTLPYSTFSHDDIINLCHILRYNQTILKLDLTGCGITKKELDIIGELLIVNKILQYLSMTKNQFSALDLIAFVRSLQNNSMLQELRVDVKHHQKFCQNVTEQKMSMDNNVLLSTITEGFNVLIILWL